MTEESADAPQTMAEAFDAAFPQYLVMGMTYEQYWDMDCSLVIPYRKAYKLRQESENRFAWLQGMYIYEALCDVSPVLHAFAKSGTRVRPYPEKPYEFEDRREKARERSSNQAKLDRSADRMNEIMNAFNASFRAKQEQKALQERNAEARKKEQAMAAMMDGATNDRSKGSDQK